MDKDWYDMCYDLELKYARRVWDWAGNLRYQSSYEVQRWCVEFEEDN